MTGAKNMQQEINEPSPGGAASQSPVRKTSIIWLLIGIVSIVLVAMGAYIVNNSRSQSNSLSPSSVEEQQGEDNTLESTPLPEPDEYIPPEELPVM